MTPAIPLLLTGLLLWPAALRAQDGPSFDCRDASTRTEAAICADPGLAALERRTVAAYDRLAARIGQREARRIADALLARRQACEGDRACIVERLLISTEVFEQRGQPTAVAEEPTPPPPPSDPSPSPAPEPPRASPQALDEVLGGARLTASDGAEAPATPEVPLPPNPIASREW
ncbi:hypothetical protein [Rubellimicrobium aerolatum]|uniref:DUF1311 domain-containing protein n=1 Tax=Rubellimicrobium aerolatum TaxID=490979 RepID=A0ABW0SGN8_9RHOB|nr:hypothetical protein [Rubellimicrobium aerolatum]MBP1807476.1 hypothetical protein [Rubellimicrobium aerolatum]